MRRCASTATCCGSIRTARAGEVTLTLEPGIRNAAASAARPSPSTPSFREHEAPGALRRRGVILPDAKVLTVPFEAVNVRSVRVTAFRVYDDNLTQFLQVNPLDGATSSAGSDAICGARHSAQRRRSDALESLRLDVTELLRRSGRTRPSHAVDRARQLNLCVRRSGGAGADEPLVDQDADDAAERVAGTMWRSITASMTARLARSRQPVQGRLLRVRPRDPRRAQFPRLEHRPAGEEGPARPLDRRDDGPAHGEPLRGVKIAALNFQNQNLAEGAPPTPRGIAELTLRARRSRLWRKGGEKGYLKVPPGVACR